MIIKTRHSEVVFGQPSWDSLNEFIQLKEYSSIFLLTDSNTSLLCLPYFKSKFSFSFQHLQIDAGEENKHIQTCVNIWKSLSEKGADRKSILINLGGGVVTDLGGFVSCTFKRGIDFINIPTSLLAMVDASVGGKTGIDLEALKNQIGIIREPKMVIIDINFLSSLSDTEYRSGYAEMLKHGIIQDPNYFKLISKLLPMEEIQKHIYHSVSIKTKVVKEDINELGSRKILNFGHTLGHAIESHFLSDTSKQNLLHGEAIAIGMVLESFLSTKISAFPIESAEEIKKVFRSIFKSVTFKNDAITKIISLLRHDKKNEDGNILFVLLESIGKPVLDQQVPENIIHEAFKFYAN
jgi:3-dehydroquinate synthase